MALRHSTTARNRLGAAIEALAASPRSRNRFRSGLRSRSRKRTRSEDRASALAHLVAGAASRVARRAEELAGRGARTARHHGSSRSH
ncbi:hypothetical protein LG634_07715 [Streptomyces bambusae]|uniref:hypothetical protein n=1 Tax=Streptomyces bambusae TaxID=1550616 RepID=UPI001CFD32CE|nr:hypothetical protein [Streptomyces bambusae]MCB5164721.1 hypothetical protein [Streptomyces bambusae]